MIHNTLRNLDSNPVFFEPSDALPGVGDADDEVEDDDVAESDEDAATLSDVELAELVVVCGSEVTVVELPVAVVENDDVVGPVNPDALTDELTKDELDVAIDVLVSVSASPHQICMANNFASIGGGQQTPTTFFPIFPVGPLELENEVLHSELLK